MRYDWFVYEMRRFDETTAGLLMRYDRFSETQIC